MNALDGTPLNFLCQEKILLPTVPLYQERGKFMIGLNLACISVFVVFFFRHVLISLLLMLPHFKGYNNQNQPKSIEIKTKTENKVR